MLRKIGIALTIYFAAEEKSVCKRKIWVSVNSMGHDLDAIFCSNCSGFRIEKTGSGLGAIFGPNWGKLKSSVSVTDGILDILNGKSTRES